MTDHRDWEKSLRDHDHGSCRDINFSEHLSREAALGVLEAVSAEWTLSSATDQDGEEISQNEMAGRIGIGAGAASTHWKGGSFLEHLQCYLHWHPADGVFCELTFFPEDIIGNDLFVNKLTGFLNGLLICTRTSEYYVRYEGASWRHGDVSPESGVIFSHHSLALGGG